MKLHANAPLGPKGRAIMVRRVVEEGRPLMEAAEAAGMSGRRCAEWVRRFRAGGEAGLHDRSSYKQEVTGSRPVPPMGPSRMGMGFGALGIADAGAAPLG